MGEIADMMLEGVLCEQCGVYLGEGDGYPTLCAACKAENENDDNRKENMNDDTK